MSLILQITQYIQFPVYTEDDGSTVSFLITRRTLGKV